MAEVVVNMSLITENTSKGNKDNTGPLEIQGKVSDVVKQFSLMIQTINTPGLTGSGLLKAIQDHQKPQQESSDVVMKK